MKKNFIGLFILLAAFAVSLSAHPLGNFSVNQFSRVEVEKSQIKVRSILDLAEIPSFQLKGEIDTDKDGTFSQGELDVYAARITPDHISNLKLTVDGKTIGLRECQNDRFARRRGQYAFNSRRMGFCRRFTDGKFRRVTVSNLKIKIMPDASAGTKSSSGATGGINIFDSTAYGSGVSDELKAYPQESLVIRAFDRTHGGIFFYVKRSSGERAVLAKPRRTRYRAGSKKTDFAELISVPEITPSIILFGLLVAFGLGAMHALSPGHGKAVVGAYLVGSTRNTRNTPSFSA